MSTCAVPACGLLLAETDPPFCPNHWAMLAPEIQGPFHTVDGYEQALPAALARISRHETEQTKHPTRLIPRLSR